MQGGGQRVKLIPLTRDLPVAGMFLAEKTQLDTSYKVVK